MTPDYIKSNLKSWKDTLGFIDAFKDSQWDKWRKLARRFMQYGIERKFNHHFRAGHSMHTFVFSTLNHYGLNYEPRVLVVIKPPEKIRLIYTPECPSPKGDEELEYELVYSDAMPTFHRFLNHLWNMTRSEPLPSDMRSPEHKFTAPVLSKSERKNSHWLERYE